MARLDVLVPHFNDPVGLDNSLASVTEQTWTGDIRIVIVDDGSSAENFAELEMIAARQTLPVLLARNQENRGRPYTRNRLLDHVDSEYVSWLDADDTWYPEKLEEQFSHLSGLRLEGADTDQIWVTCHYDWQWSGRRKRYVRQKTEEGRQLRELLLGDTLRAYLWTLVGSAASFKAVGKFDERLPRLQDLDYFIRFVRAGGQLSAPERDNPLCLYKKSDLGRNAKEIRQCNQLIFEKYRPSIERYGRGFESDIRYRAETLSARYAKNNGEAMTRAYYLSRAFAANPKRTLGLAKRWMFQGVK